MLSDCIFQRPRWLWLVWTQKWQANEIFKQLRAAKVLPSPSPKHIVPPPSPISYRAHSLLPSSRHHSQGQVVQRCDRCQRLSWLLKSFKVNRRFECPRVYNPRPLKRPPAIRRPLDQCKPPLKKCLWMLRRGLWIKRDPPAQSPPQWSPTTSSTRPLSSKSKSLARSFNKFPAAPL